ncbi:MAG: response regulator [Anaerolineae bacterium]|nr:response regulator [Anaerolineae bacterium]
MTETTRILYVEDDNDVRYLLLQFLELLGYEVKGADNGQTGVEIAEQWQPDIILMDLNMPVMDGLQAIRILRQRPLTAKIPIVVLSGDRDQNTRDECRRAGADRFFTKPPDFFLISSLITELTKSGDQPQ